MSKQICIIFYFDDAHNSVIFSFYAFKLTGCAWQRAASVSSWLPNLRQALKLQILGIEIDLLRNVCTAKTALKWIEVKHSDFVLQFGIRSCSWSQNIWPNSICARKKEPKHHNNDANELILMFWSLIRGYK